MNMKYIQRNMLIKVFSRPITTDQYAPILSRAALLKLCLALLVLLPPFFIAYATKGLWQREQFYQEQPVVQFTREIIVLLHGSSPHSLLAWSSLPSFNRLLENRVRVPLFKFHEEDTDLDGTRDYLDFSLEFPLQPGEDVTHVTCVLLHQLKLSRHALVTLQGLIYLDYAASGAGHSVHFAGELRLRQRYALPSFGKLNTYNTSVLNSSSPFATDYDLHTIIANYFTRNLSTFVDNLLPVWQHGHASGQPFTISSRIYYPPQVLFYQPDFWQVIKFAWIQYISIVVIFLFLVNIISRFVYSNFMLPTLVKANPKA